MLRFIIVSSLLLIALGLSYAQDEKPSTVGEQWKLIWNDEFNSETLDPQKWSRVKRGEADWHNTKSDDRRLVAFKDGAVYLFGILNDGNGVDTTKYITAGITTEKKFSYKYGKVQVRAKFRSAHGSWPALWMMGDQGPWPSNGEVDLMEHLNFEKQVHQTLHSDYTVKVSKKKPKTSSITPININAWNTYGCEWDENKIVFTVNGKATHTYPKQPELGRKQWPFTQPFYFIFSMQIGGDWVNSYEKTDPQHYPTAMAIDWVRVYQRQE